MSLLWPPLTLRKSSAIEESLLPNNSAPATLGVNINPSSNAIGVSLNGTSNISFGSGTPAIFARANIELVHSWQWVKGRHSMVWGANLEDSRYNEYNTFDGEGVFGFNGEWTGYDQADYLLGQFSSFTQGNGEIEFKRLH